jgi:casein kinase I family protein HRR25
MQLLETISTVPSTEQLISSKDHNILLMPFYGSGNLEELKKLQIGHRMSKKTTLQLGLSILETI